MAKSRYKFYWVSLVFLWTAFTFSYAQEQVDGDAGNGYSLFESNCVACHQMDSQFVGPPLRNVLQRVQDEGGVGVEWLHAWIRDNAALRESGDEYAIHLYEEFNQMPMTPFPNLSDQDIDDIIAYTSDPEGGKEAFDQARAEAEQASVAAVPQKKSDNRGVITGAVITGFVILILLLIWVFYKVKELKRLEREGLAEGREVAAFDMGNFLKKNYKAFGVATIVLSILALFGLWQFMININVDTGYEPTQPIHFSHKVHAGVQGIDCQYCHSSAKYGKVSGIPSPNLCMNCHKVIKEYKGDYVDEALIASGQFASPAEVRNFYTGEIHKMYESIGWDPEQNAYTGKQKPIEWERAHNLADFVYFSHEQHVVAGESAILEAIKNNTIPFDYAENLPDNSQVCFACHGNVPEMTEIQVVSPLTMGWCVDCHRTTEVDTETEFYNLYYADLHEQLKKEYGPDATVTVDAIGGLECAKCHY